MDDVRRQLELQVGYVLETLLVPKVSYLDLYFVNAAVSEERLKLLLVASLALGDFFNLVFLLSLLLLTREPLRGIFRSYFFGV